MVQGLLINVELQKIQPIIANNIQNIFAYIGNGCVSADFYKLPNGDYIIYDMGQFFQPPIGGVSPTDMNWLLMGNAVVIGYDPTTAEMSNSVSDPTTLLSTITFYDANYCEQAQK